MKVKAHTLQSFRDNVLAFCFRNQLPEPASYKVQDLGSYKIIAVDDEYLQRIKATDIDKYNRYIDFLNSISI